MLTVGKYSYPNQVTFPEALEIARTAITKFDGKMSNVAVAEALGYKVKPNAISGYIFRKFDDVCAYGLMKRQRGFLRITDTAIQALDPYDASKARDGKAKAISQMPIVKEAFTQWNGIIPQETALPSKLTDLLGVSWQEAQKHSESLRKLFNEVFPLLRVIPEPSPPAPSSEIGGDIVSMSGRQGIGSMTVSASGKDFGFTKTLPFTKNGIEELKKLITFLETQLEDMETAGSQPDKKTQAKTS
jgi:hypothetical protein